MIKSGGSSVNRLARGRLVLAVAALVCSACRTDVTGADSPAIYKISPEELVDSSFVGDTVISNLPYFLNSGCGINSGVDFFNIKRGIVTGINECQGLANFDLNWNDSDPSVSQKVGSMTQHVDVGVDIQLTRFASLSRGQASYGFSFSGVEAGPTAHYAHRIVVLPTPDRLDVPDVIVLAVGEATLLTADVKAGTGPRVTTGTIVWGGGSSVAAVSRIDSVGPDNDGRYVTRPGTSMIVKGLKQGQLLVPVEYKKSTSVYDANGALAAPAMFQKTVTVLVGQSVRIVSVNPEGPLNDPSNSQTPVSIGGQRQYRLLDQDDAVVTTQFWSSSNENVAYAATTGVVTCLSGGTATITAKKPLSSLTATTAITCQGTFGLTVLTAPLSVTAGAQPAQLDTVQISRSSFPAAITLTASSDAGITISVDPATTTGSSFVIAVSAASNAALGTHSVLLTATSGSTVVTKTFAVEVKAPVVSGSPTMTVDPATLSISAGRFSTIRAVVANGLNTTAVSWATRDASVATISDNGSRSIIVNGLKAGASTYIVGTFAYSGGTARDSTLVTVTGASTVAVASITLEPVNPTVSVGQQVQFRVRYFSASGAEMNAEPGSTTRFDVDKSNVAQIDVTTGLLTARGTGDTPVQAAYQFPGRTTLFKTTTLTVR